MNLNFSRLKEQPSELKMLTSNIQNQMNNKSQLMNKEQKKSIIENRSALIGHEVYSFIQYFRSKFIKNLIRIC